jgi:hypothetical protein
MYFLISIQNWGLCGCFSGALCEMPWLLCEREREVGKKGQFCGLNQYSENKAIELLATTPGFLAALHSGAVAGVHEFL